MNSTISKDRTKNYFKQLKGSFIFKGLAILASFLSIPLMIKYLGVEQYGIWSTLLSIISWIILFDIGIGNGLRNKISESLATNDDEAVQGYISSAYVALGMISISLLVLFLIISAFIPWQSIFNTQLLSEHELTTVVNIAVSFLFINFWLSLLNQVFNGIQKTSLVVFNQFLSNIFSLVAVYILYVFYDTSLMLLSFVYGTSLLLSNIVLSIWFYKNNYKLTPKLKYFSKKYIKSITSLGFKFFIIQIAVVVIFTTDKILITQLFGPEYVASYDILFKLFSIITIVHGLIMAPLWSAYSDAFHRNDMIWIKQTLKTQLKLYIVIVIATIVLALLSKTIISLWIGDEVKVDTMLIIAMSLFILVSTWNNIFANFINATNKLNIQIYTSLIAIILNIPLSIIFVKYYHMDVYGIVLGTFLSLSLFAVFGSLQTYNIIKGLSK